MNKKILYDWLFHYNPFTKLWCATTRSNKDLLFNNEKSPNVIKSSNINTLIEIIVMGKGDINTINNLF